MPSALLCSLDGASPLCLLFPPRNPHMEPPPHTKYMQPFWNTPCSLVAPACWRRQDWYRIPFGVNPSPRFFPRRESVFTDSSRYSPSMASILFDDGNTHTHHLPALLSSSLATLQAAPSLTLCPRPPTPLFCCNYNLVRLELQPIWLHTLSKICQRRHPSPCCPAPPSKPCPSNRRSVFGVAPI